MNTEQKLQKEIDRLTKALKVAQDLNAGLEKDKDNAFKLLHLTLDQMDDPRVFISRAELDDYDPRRWTLRQSRDLSNGGLVLQLEDKK